jgi:hypothetical protein
MKNWYCIAAALVIAACALSPAAAIPGDVASPGVSQGSIMAVRAQVRSLELELNALNYRVSAAEEAVQVAERSHEAGIGPSSDVTANRLALGQLQVELVQLEVVLASARRLVAIAQPVDIDLKSADIRRATEALSRVSGIKIAVADNVPKGVTVSAQAKSVPLGAVLEVIANAAHLTIAPDGGGGLILRAAGKLVLNGQTIAYEGGNLPWSDEWGASVKSGGASTLGRRWLSLFGGFSYEPPKVNTTPPAKKP